MTKGRLFLSLAATVAISAFVCPAGSYAQQVPVSVWKGEPVSRDASGRVVVQPVKTTKPMASAPVSSTCGNAGARVPDGIKAIVEELAPLHGIDAGLVFAVIAVESAFKANAISPKNAQGLMQLIPATARRFGVQNPFNPSDNIKGGIRYLRWLLDAFKGNIALVLAGYNAGEGAVMKHKGIPPYKETRQYVEKVGKLYGCPITMVADERKEVSREEVRLPVPQISAVNPWGFDRSGVRDTSRARCWVRSHPTRYAGAVC